MNEYKTSDGATVRESNTGVHIDRGLLGLRLYPEDVAALREYFAAYPEPKPWHSAEAGEVWVLSVDGSDDIPCIVTPYGPDFEPISHPVWATFSRGSDRITDARRIWPESD